MISLTVVFPIMENFHNTPYNTFCLTDDNESGRATVTHTNLFLRTSLIWQLKLKNFCIRHVIVATNKISYEGHLTINKACFEGHVITFTIWYKIKRFTAKINNLFSFTGWRFF